MPANFTASDLNEKQKENYDFVSNRIKQLKKSRQNHYGCNLDTLWSDADKDYAPHRLRSNTTRVTADDETRGWRGAVVNLGSSDWQSDISQSNPYIKIQTALSILVDQNPGAVFTPGKKKYQATTELMKQLYERSWRVARSKAQLKLFVFNLAKYGWACARTYPYKLERKVNKLIEYNEKDPSKSKYEEKTILEYNDIFRENLDPRNVWIDDMAKPNNKFSVKDWCWRKIYTESDLDAEFGNSPLLEKAKLASGTTTELPEGDKTSSTGSSMAMPTKEYQREKLFEVHFFESIERDLFEVHVNDVPVIQEPLPISNINGSKKLSLWHAYWNLRHAESPYGIGIYESIKYDQAMLDRIRNMTLDQLTLSIYKMFFYQGTQDLQNTGQIILSPGVGKQVLNPKDINFLEVPGPGKDAWEGYAQMRKDVDEVSGITDPLLGQVTGKTAFEIAQAKESALKRLKNPLENILEALDDEAYLTICIAQLIYSVPETYAISDERLISDYLKEIDNDPELFERSPVKDENGEAIYDEYGEEKTEFKAKIYPEFPLNLSKDEKGNLTETKDTEFFRIRPKYINWEGIINVKAQSLLSPSKQVDKALELEFFNMLMPLMTTLAQERMIAMQTGGSADVENLPHGKATKNLIMLYDKDPRDIFPEEWLKPTPPAQQPEQPLIVPQMPGQVPPEQIGGGQPAVNPELPTQPQGIVGKIVSRFSQPFKKV